MGRWLGSARLGLILAALLGGSPHPVIAAADCVIPVESGAPVARLYHGTARPGFTPAGRQGGSWRFPPGPAWLAPELEFSLHAALRYAAADLPITLLSYRPTRGLRLAFCDTAGGAEAFAVARRWLPPSPRGWSDRAVAVAFCSPHRRPRLDGYRILADRVRGEVEYVLCDPGRVLDLAAIDFWEVRPRRVGGVSGKVARRAGQGRNHYFLADRNLACFVRLPESTAAACPDHGSLPHLGCC